MARRLRGAVVPALLILTLTLPAPAAASDANVAALQVALRAAHLYKGPVDGVRGPQTTKAVKRFQRRKRLEADGVAGPATRRKLGRLGRPPLGSRVIRAGQRGWDVAALQFMLKRRGHSPGSIDGGFGSGTSAALRRFQSAAGLTADGVAGAATLRALKGGGGGNGRGAPANGPVAFLRPVSAPISSLFGPRWGRMHQGIDFAAPSGTRVGAAGRGVVSFAGWNSGGYGNLVVIRHRLGFETWYAHLASVTAFVGENVSGGTRIGYVGSTGHSTGPHLHFEVRLNGQPVNPMSRLLAAVAASLRRLAGAPLDGEGCSAHDGSGDPEPPPAAPAPPPVQGPVDPARAQLPGCSH